MVESRPALLELAQRATSRQLALETKLEELFIQGKTNIYPIEQAKQALQLRNQSLIARDMKLLALTVERESRWGGLDI